MTNRLPITLRPCPYRIRHASPRPVLPNPPCPFRPALVSTRTRRLLSPPFLSLQPRPTCPASSAQVHLSPAPARLLIPSPSSPYRLLKSGPLSSDYSPLYF